MSVKVRLTRTGAKNSASFRVVAADARSPRDGRFLEILGWYDPGRDGRNFDLKLDRIQEWKSKGAILSDTVKSLVKRSSKSDAQLETTKPAPKAEVKAEVPEEAAKTEVAEEVVKAETPEEAVKAEVPEEAVKAEVPEEAAKADAPEVPETSELPAAE
jgi:small subunit ribosomal protein S16